eukprot:365252-Chlamydomonas_euryale.AAC.15
MHRLEDALRSLVVPCSADLGPCLALDVLERRSAYEVWADLPGRQLRDVSVNVLDNVVLDIQVMAAVNWEFHAHMCICGRLGNTGRLCVRRPCAAFQPCMDAKEHAERTHMQDRRRTCK